MRSPAGGSSICSPGWSRSRSSSRRASASACSTPCASTPPSGSRRPPSATPSGCAISIGASRSPRSTTRCRPARGARCTCSRASTTTCAPVSPGPCAAIPRRRCGWRRGCGGSGWIEGYFAEGNRWLQTTLAAAPEQTPLRVEALLAGAGLSLRLGDPNGFLRHVSDAVRAYRLLGDERATAAALYQHAMLAQYVHRADAEALFAEALALARRLEDDRLLAVATHASATLPWYRGDNAAARARVLEALALLDAAPDDDTPFFDGVTFGMCLLDEGPHRRPRIVWEETVFLFHRFARAQAIAYALNNLAWVARADGDLEQAQATLDDALARFRRLEDRRGEALTLAHMGNLSRSQGDFEAARARLEKALTIRSDLGDRRAVLSTRIGLGLLAMTAGDAAAGRALLGAALAHARGGRRPAGDGRRADQLGDRRGAPRRAANGQRACTRTAARCWAFRGCSASRRGAAWRCTTSAWRSATSRVRRRRCSAHGRFSSPSATRAGCPTRTLSRR